MALPSTGELSLSVINVELGAASTTQRSLNDAALRTLFGIVTAGAQISLSDGRGKSSMAKLTIAAHQQEMNLRSWAIANGWNGTSAVEITVAAGVYIYSDNVATPALTIDGSWPGGLTLINNGHIMGKGGRGGGNTNASSNPSVHYPESGGSAISLGAPLSIGGSGSILGGGGGGGATILFYSDSANYHSYAGGGGGAGGGAGGNLRDVNAPGAGGGLGASGGNGGGGCGGGGGRIFPGTGGSGWSGSVYTEYDVYKPGIGGGAGGGGGVYLFVLAMFGAVTVSYSSGAGGSGAGAGGSGSGSTNGSSIGGGGGGGGGWGAAGGGVVAGTDNNAMSGAAGGKAIATNGNAVTWIGGFPSSRVFGAVA